MPLPGWNPLAPVLQAVASFSRHILIAPDAGPDDHRLRPLLALSLSPPSPAPPRPEVLKEKEKDAKEAPLTKEEVGRATWMLLHTIAAQVLDLLLSSITKHKTSLAFALICQCYYTSSRYRMIKMQAVDGEQKCYPCIIEHLIRFISILVGREWDFFFVFEFLLCLTNYVTCFRFPDEPTRQQRRDVKELMHIISRLYPCKECADHFKEVLKANPVQAGSQAEFSQWLCYVHNVVNRRNTDAIKTFQWKCTCQLGLVFVLLLVFLDERHRLTFVLVMVVMLPVTHTVVAKDGYSTWHQDIIMTYLLGFTMIQTLVSIILLL